MDKNKKLLEKICFSAQECGLKEKYYKKFNESFKSSNAPHSLSSYTGVQIVEEDLLPPNVMVWRFRNPADNRVFIYKEGKLYELPKLVDSHTWGSR